MFNEYFVVEGLDVAEFHIRIMTREGALVAESKDLNFRWNGLDRFGNPVPSGTYFYQIAAVGTDGLPYLEKNARGSIQVIRD
jgi:flagellar hook assembly protein FlgD